jgi:colanic acid/amylovoran biosynthesis glycosyltransferase
MMPLANIPIVILISQHPAVNHAGILREIRELRRHLEIRTASIRGPDRPVEQLSEEERDEAARTFYVKPQGFAGALGALLATLFTQPIPLVRGMYYALKLAKLHIAKSLRNLTYLAEALVLGCWMRQQNLRHLHVHYSSTVGLLLTRIFPIELSISFHGPDEFKDPAGFWLREKIEACSFVRAISHYARAQLIKTCSREQWQKIEVVYMGVDPSVFFPRTFRECADPLEVISIGRLAPVKAHHILIAAIHKLLSDGRNVLLHLVGDGPERQKLEHDVDARGIRDHVIFHGFQRPDTIQELCSGADVFALASFAEGVPGVLMEAMAMEIPCVATRITGIPELIRDGVDGLLVPPADECAIAAAIGRLADDPQLRRNLGRNARRRITEEFELGKNARQLAQVFGQCLVPKH